MIDPRRFRLRLLAWYDTAARDLPWRRTRDPYRIWISEVMLQQTRVAAVVPYYEGFLDRFPNVESLARAPEAEVLAAWSGLGYYSRVRNLCKAAIWILGRGRFPDSYEAIRAMPGVGEYTAAAIASLAFGIPHAVVDGNVVRVLSRVSCSNEGIKPLAGQLLDRMDPGRYNQALMELGAVICLPKAPRCAECPLRKMCRAAREGRQGEFPAKKPRPAAIRVSKTLLLIERRGKLLLRMHQGFWELPEAGDLPAASPGPELGRFRHSILNRNYTVTVVPARLRGTPKGFEWVADPKPVSTVARKALALVARPF